MSREGSGANSKVAHNRETLRTTGLVSPGDFLIAKESLQPSVLRHFLLSLQIILSAQYAFSRHGGIYRSDVVTTKTKSWGGTNRLPLAGPGDPGKRTRREDHALLIVRDEFHRAIP